MQNADIAVLILESEPLVLLDAVDHLEEPGFIVYQASSAAYAVTLMDTKPEIRVLFTNVRIPGSVDGLALARIARDRWPPVHIIVTSGCRPSKRTLMPADAVFVPKPYQIKALVARIGRMAALRWKSTEGWSFTFDFHALPANVDLDAVLRFGLLAVDVDA